MTPQVDIKPTIDADPSSPTELINDDEAYTYNYPQSNRDHFSRDRCDELVLNEQQRDHLSLIIKAIKEGNFDRFSELLKKKSEITKKIVNVFVDGQTVLHHCLICGRNSDWCKQLIKNGANPNLANKNGWHPIHLAAYYCCPETMLYMIDCFAAW